MIPFLYLALAACLSVDPGSDQILARDLVPAYPEMASLDSATPLAFAPAPGVARVFHLSDLRTLATRFQLPAIPDHEICVERQVAPLDPAQLLTAMRRAFPDARIEIVEYSRQPVPEGLIEFTQDGLHHPQTGDTALWNGAVRYAGNRRFVVWARVKITASVQRVLALGDLKPGRAIDPGQVLLQTREEFPAAGNFAQVVDEVAGKSPRLAIRAGIEIRLDQLVPAREVKHGETVRVDVFGGAAHLEFEGVAESCGAVGEMISVRNPSSHRQFRARVEGKGRVSVGSNSSKETR
jgi:flagella basal body P-ring formation protein FlgA